MNIAAFFDIDGTLVPPPSLEQRFLRYLRWRGTLGWTNFMRCAGPLLRETSRTFISGERAGFECATANMKAYFAGVPTTAMDAWLGWLTRHPVKRFPEAMRRLEWHARQGHRIFLLSGTLQPLAEAVARLTPVNVEVCATQLESEGGRFTGRVRGEAVCGSAKACVMERLATENLLDLERSYAYGDSFADRWMLARVGHPTVVQTAEHFSWRLVWLAQRRGWQMVLWGTANGAERKIQRRGAVTAGERRETPRDFGAEVKSR